MWNSTGMIFPYNGTTGAQVERLPDGTLKYTLHFVDGGYGDNDLTPNGLISAVFGVYTTWRTTYLPILLREVRPENQAKVL